MTDKVFVLSCDEREGTCATLAVFKNKPSKEQLKPFVESVYKILNLDIDSGNSRYCPVDDVLKSLISGGYSPLEDEWSSVSLEEVGFVV